MLAPSDVCACTSIASGRTTTGPSTTSMGSSTIGSEIMHTEGEPTQADLNLALAVCYTFKGILLQAVEEARDLGPRGYFHSPVPAVLMKSTVDLIAQLEELRQDDEEL